MRLKSRVSPRRAPRFSRLRLIVSLLNQTRVILTEQALACNQEDLTGNKVDDGLSIKQNVPVHKFYTVFTPRFYAALGSAERFPWLSGAVVHGSPRLSIRGGFNSVIVESRAILRYLFPYPPFCSSSFFPFLFFFFLR